MKKIILFLVALFLNFSVAYSFDTDFYDIEQDLDSLEKLESIKTQGGSFKPQFVSDEDFNKAIDQMKGKPREPWKFTKWLFGIKDNPQAEAQSDTPATPSEFDLLKDAMKSNNLISIFSVVSDDFGHIIPVGHYSVHHKKANGANYILLKQADKTFACFRAYKAEDKNYDNAVVYSRTTVDPSEEYINIIFSDFDNTFKARAKILK